MEKLITRNCFVCDKQLKSAVNSKVKQKFEDPPDGAVCFSSHGNYGSTVFDPVFEPYNLEIAVCDECLKKRIKRTIRYTKHHDIRIEKIKMITKLEELNIN